MAAVAAVGAHCRLIAFSHSSLPLSRCAALSREASEYAVNVVRDVRVGRRMGRFDIWLVGEMRGTVGLYINI